MPVNKEAWPLSFGGRLAGERQRIGMTQEGMGQYLDVSKTTQCHYEGDRRFPDADYLIGAQDLGIDVLYVLFDHRIRIQWSTAPSDDLTSEERPAAQEGVEKLSQRCQMTADDQLLLKRFPELGSKNRELFLQLLAELLRRRGL